MGPRHTFLERQADNVFYREAFYREARFYSAADFVARGGSMTTFPCLLLGAVLMSEERDRPGRRRPSGSITRVLRSLGYSGSRTLQKIIVAAGALRSLAHFLACWAHSGLILGSFWGVAWRGRGAVLAREAELTAGGSLAGNDSQPASSTASHSAMDEPGQCSS